MLGGDDDGVPTRLEMPEFEADVRLACRLVSERDRTAAEREMSRLLGEDVRDELPRLVEGQRLMQPTS